MNERRKVIRLVESDLRKIVKNVLERVLNENKEFAFNIDINKIPIEDLKAGYRDFRLTPFPVINGDPLYDPNIIKETVGDEYPPDEVIKRIMNKYHLPKSLFQKIENHHKIFIYTIISVVGDNEQMIIDDMEQMGYFMSLKGNPIETNGMTYRIMQFEPMSQIQEDITDLLKFKNKVLYHWTGEYNLEGILRNGLIPSHKNDYYSYPPRTYLIEGDYNRDTVYKLGQWLYFQNKNPNNNGNYILLEINLENLDENIRFFYDPNTEVGVYTEQTIPPENIKAIVKQDFSLRPNM